ncbi:MAG: hypothetical protein MR724_02475 [Prevotella sp.]|nr:hypothetical protein [Prevotella sp.]
MERKPLSSPLSGFLIYAIRHRGDAYHFLIFFLLSLGKNGSDLLVNLLKFSAHLLAGRAFA